MTWGVFQSTMAVWKHIFQNFFLNLKKNVYICNVMPTPCHLKRMRGRSGTLHHVKSVIDALSVGCLNLRNSNCVSRTMSEVNATGMQQWYPGVCMRVYYILKAHFSEVRATYRRRQSLYKFTHRAVSGPKQRTSRVGGLRFLHSCRHTSLHQPLLLGF